jgi:hypothetical protein
MAANGVVVWGPVAGSVGVTGSTGVGSSVVDSALVDCASEEHTNMKFNIEGKLTLEIKCRTIIVA